MRKVTNAIACQKRFEVVLVTGIGVSVGPLYQLVYGSYDMQCWMTLSIAIRLQWPSLSGFLQQFARRVLMMFTSQYC